MDASGTPYQGYNNYLTGGISSVYQELRLAGKWGGKGSWLIGANYEHDDTIDRNFTTYSDITVSPTTFNYNSSYYSSLFAGSPNSTQFTTGGAFLVPLGPTLESNIDRKSVV